MAQSEDFGRLVKDIIGTDSTRRMAKRLDISAAYASSILDGLVPSEEIIARIAAEYDAPADLLFATATRSKPNLDTDRIVQAACEAAGLSTAARLRVLEAFRREKDATSAHQNAA